MPRIVVAYHTYASHTSVIAHHVARRLEDRGALVRLVDLSAEEPELGVDDYDGALVAAPMRMASFHDVVAAFISRHRAFLDSVPNGFISVSLAAAGDETDLANVDRADDAFFNAIAWRPGTVHRAAGAVLDRELNALERTALHATLRKKGHEPDPSGQTIFTDWAALEAFADGFLADLPNKQA